MSIQIRTMTLADKDILLELVKRLSEFELVPWRSSEKIDSANIGYVKDSIEDADSGDTIYVAEDDQAGRIVGFIRLQTEKDYFTKEKHGYVANLAVDSDYEGQGIGRLLLAAGEAWAKENSYNQLGLHVFVENTRARMIYEKYGFQEDIIKYVKVLEPDP